MRIPRTGVLLGAAIAVVAGLAALSTGGFYAIYVLGLLAVIAVGALLLGPVGRRAERMALVLGVMTVIAGLTFTVIDVFDAVDARSIEVRGELDAREILRNYHPFEQAPDALTRFERAGDESYLTAADGEMRKVEAGSTLLALWSFGELAPWLLAALGLLLVAPLLRAADRGDPFLPSAGRRLGTLGAVLLVGVPGIVVLQWLAAQAATSGTFAAPMVTPSLSLSLLHVLPGLGLLVLAGVFRRGAELRDFDRHAI